MVNIRQDEKHKELSRRKWLGFPIKRLEIGDFFFLYTFDSMFLKKSYTSNKMLLKH